jgi:hypothetical protein
MRPRIGRRHARMSSASYSVSELVEYRAEVDPETTAYVSMSRWFSTARTMELATLTADCLELLNTYQHTYSLCDRRKDVSLTNLTYTSVFAPLSRSSHSIRSPLLQAHIFLHVRRHRTLLGSISQSSWIRDVAQPYCPSSTTLPHSSQAPIVCCGYAISIRRDKLHWLAQCGCNQPWHAGTC